MAYRPDIDGLRAIAVLAVVLFHLGFAPLEGGFVGVDIFFVISGFLITSILERRHMENNFHFGRFYLGRVRRLLPALFATITCTFVASVLIMTPDDFVRFARSALGAVASVSNILFFAEAGYWDTASELKPLLHTWSLGAEEQFYLIWPLLLVLVFGPLRAYAGLVFLVLTLLGLAISAWGTSTYPSAAFYLTPFRMFEFSLGALVIYAARRPFWKWFGQKAILTGFLFVTGLGLCFYSVLVFEAETAFPGLNALVPCFGAALILLSGSGRRGSAVRWVLENPATVWMGRVSYSMYLVHWPIITLYRYKTGYALQPFEQAGLAFATLIATIILYYGVEQKLRRPRGQARAKEGRDGPVAATTLVVGLLLGGLNLQVMTDQGWVWRMPDIQLTPEQIQAGKDGRYDNIRVGCRIDWLDQPVCQPELPLRVLLLGNSHEPDGYNFFHAGYGDREDLQLIYFGTLNLCKNLRHTDAGWHTESGDCAKRAAQLSDPEFVRSVDILVHSSRKPFWGNKQIVLDIIKYLKVRNSHLKVVTLGGYIYTELDCSRLINEGRGSESCRDPAHVAYFADMEAEDELYDVGMELTDAFIDRVDLLCLDRRLETCLTETPDGIPLMYDQHHLSREFAEYTGHRFAERNPDFFERLLRAE